MFFSDISHDIDTSLIAAVNGLVDIFIGYLNDGKLLTLLSVCVVLTGVGIATGRLPIAMNMFMGNVFRGAIVLFLVGAGARYREYVSDTFMTTFPNELTQRISAAGLGSGAINASVWDGMIQSVYSLGGQVMQSAGFNVSGLGTVIGVLLFWVIAGIFLVNSFLMYEIGHIATGIYVSLGVLFIPALLFNATRPLFERWMSALIGSIILLVVSVVIMALILKVETTMMAKIIVGTNPPESLRQLLSAALFFGVAAVLSLQIREIASSISGNLHIHGGAAYRVASALFIRSAARSMRGPAPTPQRLPPRPALSNPL